MSVNEGLIPGVDLLVLNLHDMGEGCRAVRANEVLKRRRVVVVFALERGLDFGEDGLERDGGAGSSDAL